MRKPAKNRHEGVDLQSLTLRAMSQTFGRHLAQEMQVAMDRLAAIPGLLLEAPLV